MKTLFKSTLLLTFAVGISGSIISTACSQSQHRGGYGESATTQAWGPDVVQSFPVEPGPPSTNVPPALEDASTYHMENFSDQTFGQSVASNELLFQEVKEIKNVNYFGVDRNDCCDEWSGMCLGKSLKFGGSCGGLKANKGHLGIGWLRSGYGGEDCDYCKGGCCEKGCSGKKHSLMKSCLKKWGFKDADEKSCESVDESTQTSIFGRPLKSNCDRCGCCEEGCPTKERCDSCN